MFPFLIFVTALAGFFGSNALPSILFSTSGEIRQIRATKPLDAALARQAEVLEARNAAIEGEFARQLEEFAILRANAIGYSDQLLNRTTMPRLTRCASSFASQFVMRTQPWEALLLILEGSGVPCRP